MTDDREETFSELFKEFKCIRQFISESFIEHWEIWQIVGFLERFGIGAESSQKV